MKIKKFKNLWTMGLIMCFGILVVFYILKIFNPQFIVGIAELPGVVKFGNYVDTHEWAYYLYNFVVGTLSGYLYCCACCRTRKLSLKSLLILIFSNILLLAIAKFVPQHYTSINYIIFVLFPFIMCFVDKNLSSRTFTSSSICFAIDIGSQIMSIEIRNLLLMATNINIATMTILLIDGIIWRALLYFYFNFKYKEN